MYGWIDGQIPSAKILSWVSCGRPYLRKSGLQNGAFSGIDFGAIRAPKGAPLGPHLAPFGRPSWARRRPKQASKAEQSQKRRKRCRTTFSNTKIASPTPRRRQKRPRIAQRLLQDVLWEPSERSSTSIDFFARFGSRFGFFFVP